MAILLGGGSQYSSNSMDCVSQDSRSKRKVVYEHSFVSCLAVTHTFLEIFSFSLNCLLARVGCKETHSTTF